MPFSIRKEGAKYQVITTATGKVHGSFHSQAAARRQLVALNIKLHEGKIK